MTDSLIPMLFGWPMIILALGCVLAGILFSRWKLTALGGVLFLPPAWYIGLYFSFSFVLPLFLFASAYFVAKNKTLVAFLLILPVLALTAWLGFLVLTQ
jgi:hypothetical protein